MRAEGEWQVVECGWLWVHLPGKRPVPVAGADLVHVYQRVVHQRLHHVLDRLQGQGGGWWAAGVRV